MGGNKKHTIIFVSILVISLLWPAFLYTADDNVSVKKVLVVMSYHEEYAWQQEVKEGIESVLNNAELKYISMDTKRNPAGGEARAKDAFDLYKDFMPDVVIAVDDNAQSMFVVPYLKDKVMTPVVFAGVNGDASIYGYPSSNVTGVVEQSHWREGLNFLQQINPNIKKAALIYNDTPSNRSNLNQIKKEVSEYPVKITEFVEVRTMTELINAIDHLEKKTDALLFTSLEGVRDQQGEPADSREINTEIMRIADIPTLGPTVWQVESGLLCSVAKTGQEQGDLAARMALDILNGKPLNDIPITQNRNSRRIINMTTANKLGIKLPAEAIMGTEIVMSEPEKKKVLVVMSYHATDSWQQEIRGGIESVLNDVTMKFFYLDTKIYKEGGKDRAKEAYALYQEFKPDAVIAADDNAQSMFVVPYLKDKVKTPVVFCGVNFDATKYGYPASNVTGVVEKIHYRESISLARIIEPGINKVAVLYRDTPSNRRNIEQLLQEKSSYTAEITDFIEANSLTGAINKINSLEEKIDAFIIQNMTGIIDDKGRPMEGFDAASAIAHKSSKPFMAINSWSIRAGLLCGVVRTGQEQGSIAARMVRDIFNGRAIKDIPVTQNRNGRRMINVTAARRLGIEIPPEALRGTRLAR